MRRMKHRFKPLQIFYKPANFEIRKTSKSKHRGGIIYSALCQARVFRSGLQSEICDKNGLNCVFNYRYDTTDMATPRCARHYRCCNTVFLNWQLDTTNTDTRRLTRGVSSEKCVIRRFRRCGNVIECTYTNLDVMANYSPRLYVSAHCS